MLRIKKRLAFVVSFATLLTTEVSNILASLPTYRKVDLSGLAREFFYP
jgi:hypothetical protein